MVTPALEQAPIPHNDNRCSEPTVLPTALRLAWTLPVGRDSFQVLAQRFGVSDLALARAMAEASRPGEHVLPESVRVEPRDGGRLIIVFATQETVDGG